jgi:hypothetical protein
VRITCTKDAKGNCATPATKGVCTSNGGDDAKGCILVFKASNDDPGLCGRDDSEGIPGCPPNRGEGDQGENGQGNGKGDN